MKIYNTLISFFLLLCPLTGAGYPKDANAKTICEFSTKFLKLAGIDGDYEVVKLIKGHEEVNDSVVWFVLLAAKDSQFVELEIGVNENEVRIKQMKEEGGRLNRTGLSFILVWEDDKWIKNP